MRLLPRLVWTSFFAVSTEGTTPGIMSPCLLRYLGGKPLNILAISLSRDLVFLFAFVDRSSVARPLQSRFLELPSNRSTTRWPTGWLVGLVVAPPNPPGFPKPPQPHPPQPQPPPQPPPKPSYIVWVSFWLCRLSLAKMVTDPPEFTN